MHAFAGGMPYALDYNGWICLHVKVNALSCFRSFQEQCVPVNNLLFIVQAALLKKHKTNRAG